MIDTIERHEMWTHSVTSMAPQASSAIMTNNLSECHLCDLCRGDYRGLGNPVHDRMEWHPAGGHRNRLPPGAYEYKAMELCCAARVSGTARDRNFWRRGAAAGLGLLFPGIYRRGPFPFVRRRGGGAVGGGVIPVLVVAGILEGFFSPSGAPDLVEVPGCGGTVFGVGTLALVWLEENWFRSMHPISGLLRIEPPSNSRTLRSTTVTFL